MWFRRHFTIMVLPDAHLRLRRIHLRGAHMVWALAVAGFVLGLALATPLMGLWVRGLSRELGQARQERDRLVERSAEVETTIADLRQKLDAFERRTQKLALMAGLELPAIQGSGAGQGGGIENVPPGARTDLLKGEAEDLVDRGALLASRMDSVEQAIDAQSERLARVPALLPVPGLIGAGYGWRRDPFTGLRQFHRGLDISSPRNTPVLAPADGIVLQAERTSGYGNCLTVSHGDGLVTRYGHLQAFKVRPGTRVRRGDVLGFVGSTGRSTAPHLHYEILSGGRQVDPMSYVVEDVSYW